MKAIHRKRLLKLADFLAGPVARAAKRNKARKLDMENYASSTEIGLRKVDCGTSACALGWATKVWPRVFQLFKPDFADDAEVWLSMDGYSCSGPEQVGKFFGLDYDESEYAFGPTRRSIPQEVAILRKLAAGG